MHFKKKLFIAAASSLMFTSLSALETTGFINVTNGYRVDQTSCYIKDYNPPGNLIARDILDAKNMDIYQLGFKAQLLLCDLILKMDGDYGWGGNGKYKEQTQTHTLSETVHANIHKVRVKDFSIGGGYLHPFWSNFGLGPVAGWSYKGQRFTIKQAAIDGDPLYILDGLTYRNTWQGAWLGIDAIYDVCQWNFHAGYEYHWSCWHARWHLDGPDIAEEAFSDRRKSNDVDGHVAYLDSRWSPCDGLNMGIGLKFEHFTAVDGRERPTTPDLELIDFSITEVDKVKQAIWHSFTVSFDVGYEF